MIAPSLGRAVAQACADDPSDPTARAVFEPHGGSHRPDDEVFYNQMKRLLRTLRELPLLLV